MLRPTVTHYAPWDESEDVARCGARLTAGTVHSLTPTCPTCAASLALDEAPHPADREVLVVFKAVA